MLAIPREEIKILIGCECSGMVREAFRKLGFDAKSCDLKPCETGSNHHIRGDLLDQLGEFWHALFVLHPPCTRLTNSGSRWLIKAPKNRQPHYPEAYDQWSEDERLAYMWDALREGADFFSKCLNANIPHVAVENPVMHKHAKALIENYQDPAQFIQPWWFGDPYFKATGLWLRGLEPLRPTNRLTPPQNGTDAHKRWSMIHYMSPGKDRATERSRTFPGTAEAFAEQFGAQVEANLARMAA